MSEQIQEIGAGVARPQGSGGAAQVVRTLEVVEMEIRVIQDQGRRVLLSMAIETGRRLEEAKAMVGHGQWGDWLKKMGYSQSNANNLMRVFQEYGASQQSLFGGEANSQALGNLSLTKAIRLLALPDQEEREKFVEEHDVENMTTRELEKALRERDEALKEAAAVRKDAKDIRQEVERLQEQMADQTRAYETKLTRVGAEIERAETEAKVAEEARAKMEADMKMVNASLKDQKANAKRYMKEADSLREELDELKARPVEVAVETREPTAEELERLTADAVEKAQADDRERIASMEKQLAAADGDTAAFKLLFEAWQTDYGKMMGYLERIGSRDQEKAGKLRGAVKAAVERMTTG